MSQPSPFAMIQHYPGIGQAAELIKNTRQEPTLIPFELPEMTGKLRKFLSANLSLIQIAEWRGRSIYLLDLMDDPNIKTAKAIPSYLMVARAAAYVRETNERVLIVTPTSGNKGSALRAAVARAYACGIVTSEQLRIVVVAPSQSAHKLRAPELVRDSSFCEMNPVVLAEIERPDNVKALVRNAVERCSAEIFDKTGFRIWNSLDLDNYRIADSLRAYVEADAYPISEGSRPRVHAHAVSSAYGLLGYNLGHRVLSSGKYLNGQEPAFHPSFFLIQQLATDDMVSSLPSTKGIDYTKPEYIYAPESKAWVQQTSDVYPRSTSDPNEVLDSTFYTKNPPTIPDINKIVRAHGGGGIVVSRTECMENYGNLRSLLGDIGIALPSNPEEIQEWSLVKALTGVWNGIHRNLIASGSDVIVHGSGSYTDGTLPRLPDSQIERVKTANDLVRQLNRIAFG